MVQSSRCVCVCACACVNGDQQRLFARYKVRRGSTGEGLSQRNNVTKRRVTPQITLLIDIHLHNTHLHNIAVISWQFTRMLSLATEGTSARKSTLQILHLLQRIFLIIALCRGIMDARARARARDTGIGGHINHEFESARKFIRVGDS